MNSRAIGIDRLLRQNTRSPCIVMLVKEQLSKPFPNSKVFHHFPLSLGCTLQINIKHTTDTHIFLNAEQTNVQLGNWS